QRLEQDPVEQREDRRVRTDPQRQRQDRHGRDERGLEQGPERESQAPHGFVGIKGIRTARIGIAGGGAGTPYGWTQGMVSGLQIVAFRSAPGQDTRKTLLGIRRLSPSSRSWTFVRKRYSPGGVPGGSVVV